MPEGPSYGPSVKAGKGAQGTKFAAGQIVMDESVIIALLIPFAGTALGAAFVFFMRRDMPALLLASAVTGMMPWLLSFAAGAMLYVVVEELIPEASQGEHSNIATVGFAIGFALMMALDVLLG